MFGVEQDLLPCNPFKLRYFCFLMVESFFFLRLFERQSYTKGRRGRDLNVDDLLKVATLFNDGIHGEELVERLWVLGGGLCLWGMALIRGLCVSVQVQSVFSLLLPGSPCDQCRHMP